MSVQQIFADYAISGGSLNNRPDMRSLLDAVQQGGIDVVIAEALDRVSRDQEDIAAIFKRLQHAEVCLLTLAEGEINELHVGLKGTMNALFLKDLAAKTRRGQRGRVEAGKIPGGNSYGYKIVRRLLEDGSVSTGEREIDGKQAEIVRRILRRVCCRHLTPPDRPGSQCRGHHRAERRAVECFNDQRQSTAQKRHSEQ